MITIIRVEGEDANKCLVVGNPKLPSAVAERWGWNDIPYAAQEASLIGEIMQVSVCIRLFVSTAFNGMKLSLNLIIRSNWQSRRACTISSSIC